MKMIGKILKKMGYKYSIEQITKIAEVERDIKKCAEDIEETEQAEWFTCHRYMPRGFDMQGSTADYIYEVPEKVLKEIIVKGLKKYKKSLEKKRDELL